MAGLDTLIGSGIGALGSLFGSGESDEEKAARLQLEAAQQQFANQPAYNAPALDYQPTSYAQAETPTAQTVTEDPNVRNAQIAALNSLLTRSNEGVTAEEARQQDLARRKQEQTTQGAEESIINNMAARGLGGSGMEYALRQGAAQNAADTASQGGLAREATNADQKIKALQALISGESGVRSQDYTAGKGNADIVNNFAMENSRRNNAIAAANTELANNAQLTNKQANRTDYTNAYSADVAKRKALAGQSGDMANFNLGQDVARRSETDKTLGNLGNMAAGAYNYATTPSSAVYDTNTGEKIKKYDPQTGALL